MKVNAYAAQNATTPLSYFNIQRRGVGQHDVQIEILYCGVCHSDFTRFATSGKVRPTPVFPVTKSLGALLKLDPTSKSLRLMKWLGWAAWSILAELVQAVKKISNNFVIQRLGPLTLPIESSAA